MYEDVPNINAIATNVYILGVYLGGSRMGAYNRK
jgi:hypothetical protein